MAYHWQPLPKWSTQLELSVHVLDVSWGCVSATTAKGKPQSAIRLVSFCVGRPRPLSGETIANTTCTLSAVNEASEIVGRPAFRGFRGSQINSEAGEISAANCSCQRPVVGGSPQAALYTSTLPVTIWDLGRRGGGTGTGTGRGQARGRGGDVFSSLMEGQRWRVQIPQ